MSVLTADAAAPRTSDRAEDTVTTARPVQLVIFAALAAGLCESAILMFRREVLHQFVWAGTEVIWMASLSYLALLLPIGIFFALPVWKRWTRAISGLLVFALTALISFLLIEVAFGGRIHALARLVLALGFATLAARSANARRAAFGRMVRRGVPTLVVCTFILALAAEGWRLGSERAGLARLAAAPAGAPNVLFIILDTVRAASMSLYGYDDPTTPNLQAFASRGAVFDLALAPATWTLPSHASMFTGFLPHQLSATWFTALDDSRPTLAETLRSRGYATAAFTANFYFATPETGLDRGFLRFQAYPRSAHQVLLSSALGQKIEDFRLGTKVNERRSARKSARQVNGEFLRWAGVRRDRPFFAVLNYFDAHQPYHAPGRFARRFGHGREDRYASSIAYIDWNLGNLFRELDKRGVLSNTIVIVTSDHGELFGEGVPGDAKAEIEGGGQRKCPCGHGADPYFRVLNVPLIFVGPGIPAGVRIGQPVSLRNIPATVMNVIDATDTTAFPGRSLARYWKNPRERASGPVLSEARTEELLREEGEDAGYTYSLISDSLQYIRYPDGDEMLFNIRRDPQQRDDRADSINPTQLGTMRSILRTRVPEAWLGAERALPQDTSK